MDWLRHKDRSSPISLLTPLESVRFKRGMYRFWLYRKCYAPPEYDDSDDDSEEAKNRDRAAIEFLQSLPTDDCFEVAAAAAFCAEVYKWNRRAYDSMTIGDPSGSFPCSFETVEQANIAMFVGNFYRDQPCLGPEQTLQEYRGVSSRHPDGTEDSGFFWESFDKVAAKFKLKEHCDDKLAHAIIEHDISPNDSCMQGFRTNIISNSHVYLGHRCHAVRGVDLWGSTSKYTFSPIRHHVVSIHTLLVRLAALAWPRVPGRFMPATTRPSQSKSA